MKLPIPDAYERRARLLPALVLAFLPGFWFTLFIGGAFPALQQAIVGTIGLGALVLVAMPLVRVRGQAVQKSLFAAWGGAPTMRFLRFRDHSIDEVTKQRYHAFLKEHIAGFAPPVSLDDERRDPDIAEAHYASGVKWLLEYTRDGDRFPRVAQENANYGQHRNLYSLRRLGLATSVLGILWALGWVWIRTSGALRDADVPAVIFGAVSVLLLGFWWLWITEEFVRRAADAYATALLAACERDARKAAQEHAFL